MSVCIQAIGYELPVDVLTNETLAAGSENWTADKIFDKTGIVNRHIASKDERASDFAVGAAKNLLMTYDTTAIDYLIYCTQSPDYVLPSTACIIQDRLGLPTSCGALDINLGCSGYIYGLGMAKALIESNQAKNVLLLTGDTYTKYIRPDDSSTRTLFGDGGTATLLGKQGALGELNDPFVYGTDGRGKDNLIVKDGVLHMDGPEIFAFTSAAVPKLVNEMLAKSDRTTDDIDLYVFHQANSFMLKHLQRMLKIPTEKFFIDMEDCGNTVSSTIPIALLKAMGSGKLTHGMNVMVVGFGVGYSWGATIIEW